MWFVAWCSMNTCQHSTESRMGFSNAWIFTELLTIAIWDTSNWKKPYNVISLLELLKETLLNAKYLTKNVDNVHYFKTKYASLMVSLKLPLFYIRQDLTYERIKPTPVSKVNWSSWQKEGQSRCLPFFMLSQSQICRCYFGSSEPLTHCPKKHHTGYFPDKSSEGKYINIRTFLHSSREPLKVCMHELYMYSPAADQP